MRKEFEQSNQNSNKRNAELFFRGGEGHKYEENSGSYLKNEAFYPNAGHRDYGDNHIHSYPHGNIYQNDTRGRRPQNSKNHGYYSMPDFQYEDHNELAEYPDSPHNWSHGAEINHYEQRSDYQFKNNRTRNYEQKSRKETRNDIGHDFTRKSNLRNRKQENYFNLDKSMKKKQLKKERRRKLAGSLRLARNRIPGFKEKFPEGYEFKSTDEFREACRLGQINWLDCTKDKRGRLLHVFGARITENVIKGHQTDLFNLTLNVGKKKSFNGNRFRY